jgi:hypothetical protein
MSREPDRCFNEFSNANFCLQVNGPANCECYDDIDAFPTAFPQAMQVTFSSAQAFAFPSDPFFCDTANERVCDNFKRDFACCCQGEVEAYRKCLFNKVFVPAVPDIQGTCEDSCSWNATDAGGDDEGNIEGGSGGTPVAFVASILFLVFLAICGAAFWFMRRSKQRQAHGGDGASDNMLERIKSLRSYIPNFTKGEKPEDDDGADQDIESSASLSTSSSNSGHDKDHKDSKRPSKAAQDDLDDRQSKSKKDRIRQKRDAIEHWVSDKKRGSTKSLEDYLAVELEENPELSERKQKKDKAKATEKSRRSSSNKEQSKQRDSDRGYSSPSPDNEERQSMKAHLDRLRQQKQKLKERVDRNKVEAKLLSGRKDETSVHRRNILLQDTEKMNTELGDLKTTKAYYEGCLRAAKDESIMLKEQQNGALQRIARLEEQNKALAAKLQQQGESGRDASIPHRRGRDRAAIERSRSLTRLDSGQRSQSRTRLNSRERSRSRQPQSEEDVSSGCEGNASRTKTKRRNSARRLQRSGSNRSLRSLRKDRGPLKQDPSRDVRYNSSYKQDSDLAEGGTSWNHTSLQVHDIYNNY